MENYLIIIFRTILGYAFLFLMMKIMGKREIGQLSLFDLIIALSIADIMVIGIDDYQENVIYSFLPMLIVALSQKVIALISLKFATARKFIDGMQSYIIINSKVNLKEMKKQRYNMDDLYAQLREEGIKAIDEVDFAILEASGKLSVFKKTNPINASFPVIVSGKIDEIGLKITNHNQKWITMQLKEQNIKLENVLGASIIDNKLQVVKVYKN